MTDQTPSAAATKIVFTTTPVATCIHSGAATGLAAVTGMITAMKAIPAASGTHMPVAARVRNIV